MSLREEIKTASAGLVKRESVLLPECGVTIQVRGLMVGEVQRAGNAKRSGDVQVALSAEDPASGKQIWNPNDLTDLDEIAAMHSVDVAVIVEASNRLSGMDRLVKMFSPKSENGSSSSPTPSVEASGS